MYDFAVMFESETGNTEFIASAIYSALPSENSILLDLKKQGSVPEARMYFIGFGIYNGTYSMNVINLLEEITDRKAAFFVTCGNVPDDALKNSLEDKIKVWLDDESQFAGIFVCQGRLPEDALEKYRQGSYQKVKQTEKVLSHLEELQKHPDESDCENAILFVRKILQKNKGCF